MLDHIILSVRDVGPSLVFYEAALKPLDIKFFLPYKGSGDHPDLWGFGDGKRAFFWIKRGKPDPESIHWGFMAENKGMVDEFYTAAISAGARDKISPRARLEYYPGYTPPMYSTWTGIRLKSSINRPDGSPVRAVTQPRGFLIWSRSMSLAQNALPSCKSGRSS